MPVEKVAQGTEVLSSPMLNLDFIFYLVYLFFKWIFSPFSTENPTDITFINIWKYATDGQAVTNPDVYARFGDGIGAIYDGYSLFSPPHGFADFGGVSAWFENFFTNPYCSSCPSFFDLFFGGMNGWIYLFILFGIIILFFLKAKSNELEEQESILYDTVYERNPQNKDNKKSARWEEILSLIKSNNENDWKVAIINAENLLEEALEDNGFFGSSIGERLKSADFDTVQNAWRAHKIRNMIAHDSSFKLTHQEAKIAIANFGQVFSEFYHL